MSDQANTPGPVPSVDVEVAPDEALALIADTDEAAASEARARFRTHGLEPLGADDGVRDLLGPCEQVVAVRHSVGLDRRLGSARTSVIDSIRGDLYVTTARLLLVGEQVVTFDLDRIEDSALAGESVLLILGGGIGIVLDADRPRLLRVQIAAARAARAGLDERSGDRLQRVSR